MKTIFGILMIAFVVSCQNKSERKFEKLDKMNWLVGSWEHLMPEGLLTETWIKENDSTFLGKSYFIINNKDTVHAETIILTQLKEEIFYRPIVKGQNNDEAVDFKLTLDIENSFTFENPQHDYPQKIRYKKINDGNMLVVISGKQQGKATTENYTMKRK